MKYLKNFVWIIGALLVLWIIVKNPQYATEAAQAITILTGENKCDCEK